MLAAKGSFENDSERLLADYVSPESGYEVMRVYTNPKSKYHGETEQLLDFWNAGCSFVHFTGHGGGSIWSDDALFTLNDVQFLMNTSMLPFVTSFTCFTGYFDDPGKSGLNERFVNLKEGGAIASFGSTGLGWLSGDYYLEQAMFETLFTHSIRQLGTAIANTKVSFLASHPFSADMVSLFNLLSDPAISLPLPEESITMTARFIQDNLLEVRGVISDERFNGKVLIEMLSTEHNNNESTQSNPFKNPLTANDGRFGGQFLLQGLPSKEFSLRAYAWDKEKGVDAIGAVMIAAMDENFSNLSIFSEDIQFALPQQESGDENYVKNVKLMADVANLGGLPAKDVSVTFYSSNPHASKLFIGEVLILTIEGGQHAIAEIDYSPTFEAETIHVVLDRQNRIKENNEINNTAERRLVFNTFSIIPGEGLVGTSFDGNFTVEVKKGAVKEEVRLQIESVPMFPIKNQPDFKYASLPQKEAGGIYRLSVEATNSTEHPESPPQLIVGLTLTFHHSQGESANGFISEEKQLSIYRFREDVERWEIVSSERIVDDKVSVAVNQGGIFSLLVNSDSVAPLIEISLLDEQYKYDGVFASKHPVLSTTVSDRNGISRVLAFLNSKPVEENDLNIHRSLVPSNATVVKFSPTLKDGHYKFLVEAYDLSGNVGTESLSFRVGGEVRLFNVANHPNPFAKETYFTYVLTQPADDVLIKIYTTSGRLIAQIDGTTRLGYNEMLWDGKDKEDAEVANGTYFYKIIAKTEGGKLEKVGKLAVIR